jgi:hypothetical protein
MVTKESLLLLIGDRVIAYHPILAKVVGGVEVAVFLSQLIYWHGKGKDPDGWIYKTQAEFEEETGLTRRNQETARTKLKDLGVLEEARRGVPAKMHYRLDLDKLAELVNNEATTPQTRLAEPANLDCTNPPNKNGGTEQSSLAEPANLFHRLPETTQRLPQESGATDAAPAPQEDEPTVMELFLESKRQESGRCPWCGGNVTRPGKDWPASLECPDCGVELLVSFQDGSPPKNPKRRQEDAEARGFVRKFNRGMEYTFASAIGRGDIVSANRLLGKGYTVAQAVECAQWIRAKKPQLGGHPNLGLVVRLWDEWRAAQERQPEVSDYARQLSEGEAI